MLTLVVSCALDIVAPDNCTSLSEAVAQVVAAADGPPLEGGARIVFSPDLLDQPRPGTVILNNSVVAIPTAPVAGPDGLRRLEIDGDIDGDGIADVVIDANTDLDYNPATNTPLPASAGPGAFKSIFRFGRAEEQNFRVVVKNIALTGAQTRTSANPGTLPRPDNPQGHGAAIFAYDVDLFLSNVTAYLNRAGSPTSPLDRGISLGGAVYVHEGRLSTAFSTFARNSARGGGGALAAPAGIVTVTETEFDRNEAIGREGGGILADTVIAASSRFARNVAGEGGAIHAGRVSAFFSDIVANAAAERGGGIRAERVVLSDATIADNRAREQGGGVHANELLMRRATISGNRADGAGGGAFAIVAQIETVAVRDNGTTGANASGGGLWAVALEGTGVLFAGNVTEGPDSPGGGAYVAGTATLANATFWANGTMGARSGGGGLALGPGFLVLPESRLVQTTATGNWTTGAFAPGGGIDARAQTRFLSLANSVIVGNLAHRFPFDDARQDFVRDGPLADVLSTVIGRPASSSLTGYYDTVEPLEARTAAGPVATSAQRGVLADNGGALDTVAPGLRLVDRGTDAAARDPDGEPLVTDQRGAGFDRIVGPAVDIGAAERQ